MARDTGFESGPFNGTSRTFATSTPHLRAPLRATSTPATGEARTSGCDLPDPLACHLEATARLAADAAERGDLALARALLEAALRAVEAVEARPAPGLRVVGNVGGAA
jgi:hypothetical protein